MATVDPSYRYLACQYLRKQLNVLTKELHGVRANEDIEPVHQARVASRRMRAALRMFADCFDGKQVAAWQKRVKRLTSGLGAARDRDVQIEFLDRFLATLDEKDRKHRAGIERLLLRLRQGRDALQPEIIGTLDKLDKNGTLAEMYGELGKALFTLRSHNVPLSSARVYELAGAHMRKRKDDLLAREHALGDPDDVRGHHQLRIAAKRLRYTLEICEPAYDQQLAPFIKAAKRVQSLLGDIHDCDVWAENIERFTEQERAAAIAYFGHSRPFNRLKPGLLLIRDERQAHRRDVFAELLDYWKGLEAEHLWDVLEQRLQSRMGTSDPLCHEPKNGQTDVGNEEIEKDRSAE